LSERGFNTDYWADSFVETLPAEGKLLYIYLWTNPQCNQAGLYEITLDRIAYETKLPIDSLPSLLKALEPKVKWYDENNIVWVKNFLKRQAKSPKFLVAAAKSLATIHNNGVVKELLNYNLERYSISIPYQYSIDTVVIPSNTSAVTVTNTDLKDIKGRGEELILSSLCEGYEKEIGVISAAISQQLINFAASYKKSGAPLEWIPEAFTEAANHNKRNWAYVRGIFNRWLAEGKTKKPSGKRDTKHLPSEEELTKSVRDVGGLE